MIIIMIIVNIINKYLKIFKNLMLLMKIQFIDD